MSAGTGAQVLDTQTRLSDFVDIPLHKTPGPRAGPDGRNIPSPTSSISSTDDHSLGSATSTPALTDTSSLRSSLSSLSSPTLSSYGLFSSRHGSSPVLVSPNFDIGAHSHLRGLDKPHGPVPVGNPKSQAGRRSSLPAHDTTSMASMSRLPSFRSRTRKQRETDFDNDVADDFMPSDCLMFNVPMSPALYAKQKAMHTHNPKESTSSAAPMSVPELRQRQGRARHAPNPTSLSALQRSSSRSPEYSLKIPKERGERGRPTKIGSSPGPREHDWSPTNKSKSFSKERRGSRPLPSIDEGEPAVMQHRQQSTRSLDSYSLKQNHIPADASLEELDHDARDLTLSYVEDDSFQFNDSAPLSHPTKGAMKQRSVSVPSLLNEGTLSKLNGSKESMKTSLTRPSHLPPKTAAEEKRHLEEYNKLLNHAASAKRGKQQETQRLAESAKNQTKQDTLTWQEWLSKTSPQSARAATLAELSQLRKQWWRGIPERMRGEVWARRAGVVTEGSASANLTTSPAVGSAKSAIVDDTKTIWPELGIFGPGRPLNDSIVQVVGTFLHKNSTFKYSKSLSWVAAALLLHTDEATASSILEYLFVDTLAGAALSGDEQTTAAFYTTYMKVFRAKFPRLQSHFMSIHVGPHQYLDGMMSSLLMDRVTPEAAARVLDAYLFEGDGFLLRAALGVVRIKEHTLFQSRSDVLHELSLPVKVEESAFMDAIKEITHV